MAAKHAGKAWLGVCLVSLLTACSQGSGFSDLDKFMADTRAKPRGHVEPLPEFSAYEASVTRQQTGGLRLSHRWMFS